MVVHNKIVRLTYAGVIRLIQATSKPTILVGFIQVLRIQESIHIYNK